MSTQKTNVTTECGYHSIVSEQCVWVPEGHRNICISYIYRPHTGRLQYSACIFKDKVNQMTEKNAFDCETTTIKRFELCPVNTFVDKYIPYISIIKTIRTLMCYTFGCKGPRISKRTSDTEYDCDSTNDYLSETSDASEIKQTLQLEDIELEKYKKYSIMHLNNGEYYYPTVFTKYFHSDNYNQYGYHRSIYIAFKGCPYTGDLIYAACINHDNSDDESSLVDRRHYDTAAQRLLKSPVYLKIDLEFQYQLDVYSQHHEDITHIIVENILKRKKGRLQIKQY